MKKLNFFFSVTLLLMLFSISCYPKEISKTKNEEAKKKELISQNLLIGINSENFGLKTSSSFFIGEFCCKKAVIPLLKILHNDEFEESRILAALALYKIGDSRGIFAIKQAIRFDKSERVRKMCDKFYRAYHSKVSIPDEVLMAKD